MGTYIGFFLIFGSVSFNAVFIAFTGSPTHKSRLLLYGIYPYLLLHHYCPSTHVHHRIKTVYTRRGNGLAQVHTLKKFRLVERQVSYITHTRCTQTSVRFKLINKLNYSCRVRTLELVVLKKSKKIDLQILDSIIASRRLLPLSFVTIYQTADDVCRRVREVSAAGVDSSSLPSPSSVHVGRNVC